MRKRMLAMLLAVIMIISLLPTTAFAADAVVAVQSAKLKNFQSGGTGSASDVDLLSTTTIDGWAWESGYPLEVEVDLSGGTTNRSLAIQLYNGVKFVNLDLDGIKKLGNVKNATYEQNYLYGDPSKKTNGGILTVEFPDEASGSVTISITVAADAAFFQMEQEEWTTSEAIGIKVSDNEGTTNVKTVGMKTAMPGSPFTTGEIRQYTGGNISTAAPGRQFDLLVNAWVGFLTYGSGTRYNNWIDYMEIDIDLTEGVELCLPDPGNKDLGGGFTVVKGENGDQRCIGKDHSATRHYLFASSPGSPSRSP